MKYKIFLNEDNYLVGYAHTNTEEDIYELSEEVLKYYECYHLEGSVLILDIAKKEEAVSKEEARKREETHEENIEAQTRNLAEMFISSGEDSTDFMDRIDAQVLYTALMTDSLIDEDVVENATTEGE